MAKFTFAPSTKVVPSPVPAELEFEIVAATGVVRFLDTALPGANALGALPSASIEYLLTYGLKQSLADSYASAKTQAEFDSMLVKRINKLLAGDMTFREGNGPANPFEVECVRIAKAKLDALAKRKGKKLPKRDSDEYKALLSGIRTKFSEEIEVEARRRMAEAEAIDLDDDLDIDDLVAGEPEEEEEESEATE